MYVLKIYRTLHSCTYSWITCQRYNPRAVTSLVFTTSKFVFNCFDLVSVICVQVAALCYAVLPQINQRPCASSRRPNCCLNITLCDWYEICMTDIYRKETGYIDLENTCSCFLSSEVVDMCVYSCVPVWHNVCCVTKYSTVSSMFYLKVIRQVTFVLVKRIQEYS